MFETLKMFSPWAKEDQSTYNQIINNNNDSITAPKFDDGAIEYESDSSSYNVLMQQFFGSNISPEVKNTTDLIKTYRSLVNIHEVDNAVSEIVNDAIVFDDDEEVVSINLDNTSFSDSIKTKIQEEFDSVLNILDFRRRAQDHFRRWYIDSRIYFHKVIDVNNPKKGIMELRRLNPFNVQYVREIITETENNVKVVKGYKESFIYDTGNESYTVGGRIYGPNTKISIPKSAIVYAHSGLVDDCGKNIIGYLHRAVKPANQLKLLEDAMVIYRITRSPERRVFYIDTGNMPNKKATQHMNNIMNGLKNRVVYDATTGKIKNQQHNMAMTEDYWLQRRDGKAVTDVTSLPGATGMNEIEDVRWFNQKLYEALRIPLSRIPNPQGGVNFGMGSEITRDELNFFKFIKILRHQFEAILSDPLKSNLILKKIITEEEWNEERNNIKIIFNNDSYFTELKDAEILERRLNMLQMVEPFIGKYYSNRSVMKDILKMTDEQIEQEFKQIELESKDSKFNDEPEDF